MHVSLEPLEVMVLKKSEESCRLAMRDSIRQVSKDLMDKVALRVVKEYYSDYPPNIYRRKDYLKDAFNTLKTLSDGGMTCTFAVDWDYRRMPQHKSYSKWHKSGGKWKSRFNSDSKFRKDKKNFGTPDNDWIFGNFMEGKHMSGFDWVDKKPYYDYGDESSEERLINYMTEYFGGSEMSQILIQNLKKYAKRFLK